MKYVMLRCSDAGVTQELPIIFPGELVHKLVVDALLPMLQGEHRFERVEVVGAGEARILCASCSGSSSTLQVPSRGNVDKAVIQLHDYAHGLILDGPEESACNPSPD